MHDLIKIRGAQSKDVDELAMLGYFAWESGILPMVPYRNGMKEEQQARLANYTRECFHRIVVAEFEDEIVGWCSHARAKPYIPFLFTSPYMQRRGIGSALLRRVETMLELRGYDRVFLETPADHVQAVRFYEHQGYGILAMKADGHTRYEPYMSIRLEKRLHPYNGVIEG